MHLDHTHLPHPSHSSLPSNPATSSTSEKKNLVIVCPAVDFAHTPMLAKIHGHELLVWFEASDFCYTINNETLLGLR